MKSTSLLRTAARLLGSCAIVLCLARTPAPAQTPNSQPQAPIGAPAAPAGMRFIQSQPLFQEADLAARNKQFARAAQILERLATTPGVDARGKAYCLSQRDYCLKQAAAPEGTRVPPPAFVPPATRDCGPVALRFALTGLGIEAPLSRLSLEASTARAGTTMAGLAAAAKAEGAAARGVQVDRYSLARISLPAVAWVNGSHFVAVLKIAGTGERDEVVVHDPGDPAETSITVRQLLTLSKGYLLVLNRPGIAPGGSGSR